ncbi:MAG: hypothetical protein J6M53_04155 [Bacteroidaceae bacterium]|nr:hypothetical protein [Bacteroidaceae bacterium]
MKKRLLTGLAFLALPLVYFSCSSDELFVETDEPADQPQEVWLRPARPLLISGLEQAASAGAAQKAPHRIVMTDEKLAGGEGVTTKWNTTDEVGVWNVTAAAGGQQGVDVVRPKSEEKYVQFAGDVHCDVGDKIAMFYPATSASVKREGGTLTFDLSEQKGTLEDIAKNFDIMYGAATVESIRDNGEAVANLGFLQSGVTLFVFSFTPPYTTESLFELERVSIKIEGGGNQGVLNLDTQEFSVAGDEVITVRPDAPTTSVYVAVPGNVAGKQFKFDLVDKYGFSHKASAKAPKTVTPSQVSRAKLRSMDGEYIEIEGVKWAKGNLLWFNGELTNAIAQASTYYTNAYSLTIDNYFIAPQQYWSPEQLKSKYVTNIPVWPGYVPNVAYVTHPIYRIPSPTYNGSYYATYFLGLAGHHGETSARGRYPTGGNFSLGASLASVNKSNKSEDLDFSGKLFTDEQMTNQVTLEAARNLEGSLAQWGTYYGDLAYLASNGRYEMPDPSELYSLFNHENAVWGVYFQYITTSDMEMRDGVTKTGQSYYAPIYGLYINKVEKPTTATHDLYVGEESVGLLKKEKGWKGQAFVLSTTDMSRGIFLPAEGKRSFGSGSLIPVSKCVPGEFCGYYCSLFGSGGYGSANARLFTARPDNNSSNQGTGEGRVNTAYEQSNRTQSGAIRPVLVGNVFE